jgi:type IV fimbrial biogenesis protein FimT
MRHKTIRGFTIPELIITLGVAAIILSTAVPSVSNTIKDNRLATRVNDVITDIHFARSEAAKRDVRVILCRRDTNASGPACGDDSSNKYTWTNGYLIFADDGNGTNSTYEAGSDILLRIGQPAASGVTLLTNPTWNKALEFNPNGSLHESGIAIMSICDDREEEDGRQIVVSRSGIPSLYSDNIDTCKPYP